MATPRPWKAVKSAETNLLCVDGPPQGLAGRWRIAMAVSDEPIDEANADLIVLAVNAYDEMLAALKFVDKKLAEAGWADSVGGVRHRVLVAIAKAEEKP